MQRLSEAILWDKVTSFQAVSALFSLQLEQLSVLETLAFPENGRCERWRNLLIPWVIFLFIWSIPLVIAEFAMGKRSRTGTVGTFRIFAGRNSLGWDCGPLGFPQRLVSITPLLLDGVSNISNSEYPVD